MLRGILNSRGFGRCPLTRRDAHLHTCEEYTEYHSLHLIPLTMPLEAPIGDPNGYNIFEQLFRAIEGIAKTEAYAIIKRRPSNYKDGVPRRWDVYCDVGGYNPLSTAQSRIATSRKRDCPWSAKAVRYKIQGDRWFFVMRTNEHNHDPSIDNVAHPAYRRRNDQQVKEIRELMRNTATGSRAITSLMEARHPDQPWKRKDVQNEMTRARTESLGGYSPTQALIRTFRDRNIKHFIRQLEGFITGLIWTYPHCEQLWKQ